MRLPRTVLVTNYMYLIRIMENTVLKLTQVPLRRACEI
ncbi:hypothetical protein ALQ26_200144 [Pseudomonas amygdali pv. lachrymans]|nr:hypothetical protein ALQ26_200144 [Pseudomonas amygdali pv. lachrymans]